MASAVELNQLPIQGHFEAIVEFLIGDRGGPDGLSTSDRRLAEIGCLLTVGPARPELGAAFRTALEDGTSTEYLEAMLVHSVGYLGVIVTRDAHETYKRVCNDLGIEAIAAENPIERDREARVAVGERLYDRFDPGRQSEQADKFRALSPIYYPRAMELSGLVLSSQILSLRERQIMTIAMLSCLGGQEAQLRFHIGVAIRNDVERDALADIAINVLATTVATEG
jgi:alkylhydroperoxidase/carboxymuconolactone decarboxylase family protein YurZ